LGKNTYQIFFIYCISLRYLICYVQYWTRGEEYISDFLYSLHFFKIFDMFSIELVEKNKFQIFIIHYISLRDLICYVQYWTREEKYISDFHCSLYFFKRFDMLCSVLNSWRRIHIRFSLFFTFVLDTWVWICMCSIELVNMSMFQDHELCHSSVITLLLFIHY
jgi:hypothetical protein